MSSVSAKRPTPESVPVSLPTPGSTITTPRFLSVSMFCFVAGCSHISVCIAGAIATLALVASNTFIRRSSAIPAAYLAIKLAVAGATTIRSTS